MTTQSKLGLVWALNGGTTAVTDVKYENGWIAEIPTYQNFNYMVQTLDKNILKYAEEDVFDWDETITYAVGAKVKEGSIYYTCKAASINNSPVADITNIYWVRAFLFGDDYSSLLETDGLKIELPARSNLNYAASDLTITNNAPLVKLETTSGSHKNLALANVSGEAVVADLGLAGPDARDLSLDAGNSHRIFHEGHVPTVSEVTDAVEEATQDSVLYARKDGAWVKVTSTSVALTPPAVTGDGGGWYNLEDGQLYLDIDDGDTSQWVPASPPQVLDHYTDRVVDETITGAWTFEGDAEFQSSPVIQAVGVDAGGSNGANIQYRATIADGTDTTYYTQLGASSVVDGAGYIQVKQSSDDVAVAQWNFTEDGIIDNTKHTAIKHNVASFQLFNGQSDGQISGAPDGWDLTHTSGTGVYTITHNLGYTVYPVATPKDEDRMAYPSVNDTTTIVLNVRHIGTGISGSTINVHVPY